MITYINASELRKLERGVAAPFELNLRQSPHNLIINDILRNLPGRRLTALATWKGEQVVAKIFFHEDSKYFQRDLEGVGRLNQAAVPTPKLLFTDSDRSGTIFVLIFEYIKDAKSLSFETELTHYHRQIMGVLAKLHSHGMVHDDLHLDNFLVKNHTLYCVDGDAIRQINPTGSLNQKASLKNVAQYFSQFSGIQDLHVCLEDYMQRREWGLPSGKIFQNMLKAQRYKRLKKYGRKVLHSCTAVVSETTWFKRQIQPRDIAPLHGDMDALVAHGIIIKDGNTCTVAEENDWIIKRYNMKSIWHGLSRALRLTRAENSWAFSHILQLLEINTAAPIALVERRLGPFRGKAYFVSEKIQGMTLDNPEILDNKDGLCAVIDVLHSLYANQLSHGDLKASNFIIKNRAAYLIDLDSATLHRSSKSLDKAWKKDISRFLRNWDNFPEIKQFFTNGLQLRGLLP